MSKLTFTRGYDNVKEKVKKSYRYTRSCDNCHYFYLAEGDKEELCQNSNVLPYDVCVDEGRVYCSFWKYVADK